METKGPTLHEIKRLIEDCFPVNPLVYWLDFLISCFLGYGAFVATEFFPLFSLPQLFLFFVSVFCLYRAVLFIHELTHQERKNLPGFSLAWNLLVGVPTLFPSFMYRGVHLEHHKKNSYATDGDGEYLPLGASSFPKTLQYLSLSFLLPILVVVRFGLLGPISLLHPQLRRLVMEKASALAIRFDVKRKIPTGRDLRHWYVLEFLCFLYVSLLGYLFVKGFFHWGTLLHIYLAMASMFFVNSVRTVVAHRYKNADGRELPIQEQILDSVNLEGNVVVAELFAPVGLRFHALHHLFPSMPYHSLGRAHRRLREILPKDSFYHQTVEPSLGSALLSHWKNTRKARSVADKNTGTPQSLRA